MAFVHLPPSNESAFFEIAATLIPILLFGGVLVERAKPPPEGEWRIWHDVAASYLPLFGAIAIFGEALAIRSAVAGEASTFARVYVSLVLVLGMTSIITAISMPWLSGLRKSDAQGSRPVRFAGAIAIAFGAIGAFALMVQGTNVAAEKERDTAYGKAITHNIAEQEAVHRQIQSLWVQIVHVHQRVEVAAARGDAAIVRSLRHEIDGLNSLTRLDFNNEERLLLESVNLYRETVGARTLKQLPHKKPAQPQRSRSRNDAPR